MNILLTVRTTVPVSATRAWEHWNNPAAIATWCHASDDWGVGEVTNDLRVGGSIATEMKALDSSETFLFGGIYSACIEARFLSYTMDDSREVSVYFIPLNETTTEVIEVFAAETENSHELQIAGWQAILDNYAAYCSTAK